MRLTTSVTGGNRLGAKLKQIRDRLERNKGVYVGLPEGTGSYEDGAPIAVIAAVQEFGSADGLVPERSFLRVPLRQNGEHFKKVWRANIPRVISGEMTMHAVMDQLGGQGVRVSVEAIEAGLSPELKESTKKRRKHGGDTPLWDSGELAQSITHIVED